MPKRKYVGFAPKRRIAMALLVTGLFMGFASPKALAFDFMELDTVEGMEGKTFEFQEELKLEKFDSETEWTAETNLEYEFTKQFALQLRIPYEFGDDNDSLGDVGLRFKFVFNPDSQGVIAGVTAEVKFPTGDDSSGVGGDLRLRLSKWSLGASEKHGIHADLRAEYNPDADSGMNHLIRDDEEDERDFQLGAVLGYTYDVNEKTTLVADLLLEQLEEEGAESAVFELGFTHKIAKATDIALGIGAGLGADSPDFVVHTGIQIRF